MGGVYAQCSNIGFQQGNFNNWVGYTGTATVNANVAKTGGLDPSINVTTGQHLLLNSTAAPDPLVPALLQTSPLGGKFARIGNLQNGALGAGLEYSMTVDYTNAYLTLWYAVVLEDPEGDHLLNERPYFQIKLRDASGKEVDCFTYFVAGQPGVEGFQTYGTFFWRDWTSHSIVLKDYIGQTVTLQVEASDCQKSGHLGYGYVDAKCQPLELIASTPYVCSGVVSTLTAPADMATYEWRFGGGVISTDRIITVTEPGKYTCSMVPPSTSGVVCPFELDITLDLKPDPEADFKPDPIPNCLGVPTVFANTSKTPGSTIKSSEWNLGDGTLTTVKDPTHTYTAAGIYDVELIITSAEGCKDTIVGPVEIVDPAPPTLTGPIELCDSDDPVQLGFTPLTGATFTGTGVDGSGVFDPKQNFPGPSKVFTITLNEDVCDKFVEHEITVFKTIIPEIIEVGPYCDDEPSVTLSVDKTGGYWEGPGIVDGFNGVFDPADAGFGDQEVFYRLDGQCAADDSIIIIVNHRPEIIIQQPPVFCPTEAPYTIVVNNYDGTWTGPGVSPDGVFDPAAANVGNNKLVYFIDGDCPIKDSVIVVVKTDPSAKFDLIDTICSSETNLITLIPDDIGGKWAGPGIVNPNVAAFDPKRANIGANTVTYTIGGQCSDFHAEVIYIIKQPVATITPVPTLCPKDGTYQIKTADLGGIWSGPFVSATGVFDAAAAGPGTYNLDYRFNGRCPDDDQITITVTGIVPADFANPGPLCETDAALNLIADNPGGTWAGNGIIDAANGLFDPAVAGPGTHTISYNSPTTCGETKTQDIVVVPMPKPTFIPVGPLCPDGAVVPLLSSIPGVWEVDGVTLPDNNFDPVAHGPGVHNVVFTITGVCTYVANSTVEVAQPLNLTLNSFTNVSCNPLCDGTGNVSITGGPIGSSYQINWANSAGTAVPGGYVVNGLCADSYMLTVVDDAMCTATLPLVITQPAPVTVNVTSVDAFCGQANGEASAAPTGGDGTYNYDWRIAGQSTSFATGNPFTFFPAGNYIGVVTDGNGCVGTEPFTIADLPGPTITVSEVQEPSCNGASDGIMQAAVAGANGTFVIVWNDGAFTGPLFPGVPTGNYKAAVMDNEGCASQDIKFLNQPNPVSITTLLFDTICDGQSTILRAAGGGGTPYTGATPYEYSWSTMPSSYTYDSLLVSDAGIFDVVAIDAHGCVSPTATINVFEYAPLVLTVSNDTTLCPGEPLSLWAIPSGGRGTYTLTWDNGSFGGTINSNTSNYSDTTYQEHVVLTDGCSTPADRVIKVTVSEKPQPTIDGIDLNGCEPLNPQLFNISPNSATTKWTVSDGTVEINKDNIGLTLMAGSYNVRLEITTHDGCYGSTDSLQYINVYPTPVADFRYQPEPADVFSSQIQMLNKSYSNIKFNHWVLYDFNGDSIKFSGLPNPYFKIPEEPGTMYARLAVTTIYGCVDTVLKPIIIEDKYTLYVPNTFTPDGDGYNEIFIPRMFNIQEEGYELTIWNRWGELLFETIDQKIGWDGTYQGEVVKEDTYIWKIKYKDLNGTEQSKYGHINLLK